MITPETGAFRIAPEVEVLPSVKPTEIAPELVEERAGWDDPHGSCWLVISFVPFDFDGHQLSATLRFINDVAYSVTFGLLGEHHRKSWEEWRRQKEVIRCKDQEHLLTAILGQSRDFPWGMVWSGFDERSGGSGFGVNFRGSP